MKMLDWLRGQTIDAAVGTVGEARTISARVKGKMYRELPEGHKTTFVVGLIDMFCLMAYYTYPQNRGPMAEMMSYAAKFESDYLRREFDEYMAADPARGEFAVSGCFATFLRMKASESPKS